ncbi:unnamed protein product [Cyprideis torosa]|uniref:N-alpha-acetyltransferase 40 n=1 Tax=Cyprideis torosa TaxID=163714 RepID=A0A7R8ZMB5_9CRUS|nr:unnamed protein product [Cyprideis torosa]CAG0895189.1 unnamed protein product [Cyprideis torosa]
MPSRKPARNPVAVEKEKLRKEKRRALKEQRAKILESKTVVDAANAMCSSSLMEGLSAFKTYKAQGREFSAEVHRRTEMDSASISWAFDLTKLNMEAIYKKSESGWTDSSKRDELDDERAWFLIVEEEGRPVAFSHFRFDLDGEGEVCCEVLYCYELQVAPCAQGIGLGKHMMRTLEIIGFKKADMCKVVLTCFKHNVRAMRFYKEALGYKEDITSPVPGYDGDDFDYEILSKPNKRKVSEDAD